MRHRAYGLFQKIIKSYATELAIEICIAEVTGAPSAPV